jgi:hypothetical protein
MSTLPAGGAHGGVDWIEQARERLAGWSRPGTVASLWAIGGVLDLVFLIAFTLRFPIVDHYRGLTDVASLSGKSASGALLWAASLTVAFALYALGWRRARAAGRAGIAPVLATGLVATLVLLFAYPVTAIDEYVYLVHGRIWAFHGGNPLVQPPNLFPDERLLNMTGEFGNAPAPYGPLWIGASGLVARLAGDDLLVGLLLFKGLAVASYAVCAWLISRLLVATGDEEATAGTLLFAWNPVVLIDVAGNGHNDAAMMALVLAAVAATRSRWRVAAPALLCLAALVKYVAGALVPLLLIELWCSRERLGGRLRLVGGATGLAVVA